MKYTLKVIEIVSGTERVLPADAVTRALRTPSPYCPVVPLGFRAPGDTFFVSSERWPDLDGKALRVIA